MTAIDSKHLEAIRKTMEKKTLKQQIVEIFYTVARKDESSEKFYSRLANQIISLFTQSKNQDRDELCEEIEKMKYDLGCPCKICELHNKDLDQVIVLIKNNKLTPKQ